MARLKLVSVVVLIIASALTAAHAGTVIVVDMWAYDQYSESGTATLYLGENKLRVEFVGKETTVQTIFDVENKDAPIMWEIDPASRSYTEMDAKAMKKTQDKAQQSYEIFDNYMRNASAEERAEITKQYKELLRQADDLLKFEERMKKTAYQKVASGEKINAWTCDHLKGIFNKEKRIEVWIAQWSDLGLEYKDVAVLTAIAETFKGFAGGEIFPFTGQKVEGSDTPLDGFPVKTVFYEDGNKIVKQEVKEIRKEELDPKLFALPEGYKEESPNVD